MLFVVYVDGVQVKSSYATDEAFQRLQRNLLRVVRWEIHPADYGRSIVWFESYTKEEYIGE